MEADDDIDLVYELLVTLDAGVYEFANSRLMVGQHRKSSQMAILARRPLMDTSIGLLRCLRVPTPSWM